MYSDALDRRERRHSVEQQIFDHENAERRVACQVLGRSRRYYWQMLERQVKEAFDQCAGGSDALTYPALEEFLMNFGVLLPPKSQTPIALERAAEESRRLRVALWRYLDPDKLGYVDFLTLTVFLHVLMGAVDEEAACLNSLSSAQGPQIEEIPVSASATTSGSSHGLNKSNNLRNATGTNSLTAIVEEDDTISPRMPVAVAAASAAAAADPEGKRICELLIRFDARRLRAEFKQLYLDRMHYAQQSFQHQKPEEPEHQPELDPKSRVLAEKVVNRQREDAGDSVQSHSQLMHWRHSHYEAKKEEQRVLKEMQEAQKCTFQPELVATSSQNIRARAHSAERAQGSLYNRLYNHSVARQRIREQKAVESENIRNEQELSTCTFRPDLKKSVRSYTKNPSGSPQIRGFDESKQRNRRAFAASTQKRRFLDDRFFQLSPGEKPGDVQEERSGPSRIHSPYTGWTQIVAENSFTETAERCRERRALASSPAGSISSAGGGGESGRFTSTLPVPPPLPGQSDFVPIQPDSRPSEPSAPLSRTPSHQPPSEPPKPQQSGCSDAHLGAFAMAGVEAWYEDVQEPAAASSGAKVVSSRGVSPASARRPSVHMASPQTGRASSTGAVTARTQRASPPYPATQARSKCAERRPAKVPTSSPPGGAAASRQAAIRRDSTGTTPPATAPVEPITQSPSAASIPEDSADPVAPPLVYVEVNIQPNRPPERLTLHHGQSPAEAAADFAVKHRLAPALAQRLHVLLQDLLSKPEVGRN